MSVDMKHKRTSPKHEKEHPKIRTVTIMAQAFFHYSRNSTSVAIIYVLAVMLVARYTTGYIIGIIAAVFGVFFVNYVFKIFCTFSLTFLFFFHTKCTIIPSFMIIK